jgi:hypothetical protein
MTPTRAATTQNDVVSDDVEAIGSNHQGEASRLGALGAAAGEKDDVLVTADRAG